MARREACPLRQFRDVVTVSAARAVFQFHSFGTCDQFHWLLSDKRLNGDDRQEPDHDLGPKDDGTAVVEFRTAWDATLAISIPRNEAAVIRYFQERMPYGLLVPDVT